MPQSKPHKPTQARAYGSIGHIQGSHLTSGDKYLHEGQSRILTTKARDRHDTIIVQEKYDGTCVAVVKLDGKLIPIQRRGYSCEDSPHEQHRHFAAWVRTPANAERFSKALDEGQRIVGEWLIQAHGTRYRFSKYAEPFVAFDIFTEGNERLSYMEFGTTCDCSDITTARLVHYGSPVPPDHMMNLIKSPQAYDAYYPKADEPEGLVYRCERHGKVDFLGKYVRPGFVPGLYFQPDGVEPVWNMDPHTLFSNQKVAK